MTEQLYSGTKLGNQDYFNIIDSEIFNLNISSCTVVQDNREYFMYGNKDTER